MQAERIYVVDIYDPRGVGRRWMLGPFASKQKAGRVAARVRRECENVTQGGRSVIHVAWREISADADAVVAEVKAREPYQEDAWRKARRESERTAERWTRATLGEWSP